MPSLADPGPPGPVHVISYPAYGVSLRVPANWTVRPAPAPLVFTVSSGTAVVALWSYRRSSGPPADPAALARAQAHLVAAVRRRDPTLRVIRSSAAALDHRPAIELDAFERIAGQPRRVRSTHVFTPGAEVVLDMYAPPDIFHDVDHAVFSPLKRSLRVVAGSA